MPKYVPPKEGDVILAYLPGNSQAFLKRIQVYLAAKERLVNLDPTRLQQHQQRVDNALNENPDDVEKLHELAILYELQGEFSKATDVLEDLLEKLLEVNQDCPDIYMQLGALYEAQERDEGALDAYREACENWKKGGLKLRPAICLRKLPPHYQDFLVCGISSQTARRQLDFDEVVGREFDRVKLMAEQSVIRLGFLGRVGTTEIVGRIGSISPTRHRRLLKKLGTYLVK
jgi:mRNA interferase MazF